MVSAVARLIELRCNVKSPASESYSSDKGLIYRKFWSNLMREFSKQGYRIPTIISFNYDLVLERALYQVFWDESLFMDARHPDHQVARLRDGYVNSFELRYHYNKLRDIIFEIGYHQHGDPAAKPHIARSKVTPDPHLHLAFDIIKLHG